MSNSQADHYTFVLDGKERLGADFDDDADVLYLWRGDEPRPSISLSSIEGHLVRVAMDSAEIVGFTIFGWGGLDRPNVIKVTVPAIARDQDDEPVSPAPTTHDLKLLVPA